MKKFLKTPFTVWFVRLTKSLILEYKNKKNHLKIGNMSLAIKCDFGIYNTIYENVYLENVSLNDFTYISNNTNIINTKVGKFCSIGPNCKIGLGKHPTKHFVSTHPVFFSNLKQAQISFVDKNIFKEFEQIIIENDVWIGANVIVLDGVQISDGAIIAAGSVVTKDVPPYAIMGGIPAKVIKYRFSKDEILKLLDLKWWNETEAYLKQNVLKMSHINNILNQNDRKA